jgi:hypothetical protein
MNRRKLPLRTYRSPKLMRVYSEQPLIVLRPTSTQLSTVSYHYLVGPRLTSSRQAFTTASTSSLGYPCSNTTGNMFRKFASMIELCKRPALARVFESEYMIRLDREGGEGGKHLTIRQVGRTGRKARLTTFHVTCTWHASFLTINGVDTGYILSMPSCTRNRGTYNKPAVANVEVIFSGVVTSTTH